MRSQVRVRGWRAEAGAVWRAWVGPWGPGPEDASPEAAFLEYYQQHLEYACPTEDIYLE